MKVQAWILSGILAFPLTMMGQSMANQNNNQNKAWNNSSQNTSSQQLSNTDQHFLSKLAREDQSEIDMAHLALKKSSNPQVRNYAQNKILAADPSMEHQAKNLAQRDNAMISATPTTMAKQEYDRLSNLSGKQFDQAYMKYEARKQEADLDAVQHEINSTNNQKVKNYAENEETPVRQASQSAQRIDKSMGTQTGSSGSMGMQTGTPNK